MEDKKSEKGVQEQFLKLGKEGKNKQEVHDDLVELYPDLNMKHMIRDFPNIVALVSYKKVLYAFVLFFWILPLIWQVVGLLSQQLEVIVNILLVILTLLLVYCLYKQRKGDFLSSFLLSIFAIIGGVFVFYDVLQEGGYNLLPRTVRTMLQGYFFTAVASFYLWWVLVLKIKK